MNSILSKVVDNYAGMLGEGNEGKAGAGGEEHGSYREGVPPVEGR